MIRDQKNTSHLYGGKKKKKGGIKKGENEKRMKNYFQSEIPEINSVGYRVS